MGSHGKGTGINLNDAPEATKSEDEGRGRPEFVPPIILLGSDQHLSWQRHLSKSSCCFTTLFLRSPTQGVFSEGSGEETLFACTFS